MFAGVLPGNNGCTSGRASRVGAVGAIKQTSSLGEPIEIGRFYLRVVETNSIPMLLIAGDE